MTPRGEVAGINTAVILGGQALCFPIFPLAINVFGLRGNDGLLDRRPQRLLRVELVGHRVDLAVVLRSERIVLRAVPSEHGAPASN